MDRVRSVPAARDVAELAAVREVVQGERAQVDSCRWPAWVAIAPMGGPFMLAIVVVGGWAAGVHPFWPTPEITLSEAAAIHDAGELYRLLVYEHRDPNRPWPVRPGMADDDVGSVLPLEMAVRARRPEIVRILLDHGAIVGDADSRARLICVAAAGRDPDVLNLLLATGDRSDPRTTCPPSE